MELNKSLEEMKAADVTAVVTDESLATVATAAVDTAQPVEPPLFDESYDDWAAFDAAIARATAAFHPIRKRSSLTFEVYNRTVSKGRHDRKNIAEFLSKTFKCTHGIKFRSRGSGKRLRHRLRDIGCPFHVYASAVEYGPTYRVKVRMHDKHNHPIGPDSMKMMSGALHESDYELATHDENDAASAAETAAAGGHLHQIEHAMTSENHDSSAEAVYERQMREQLEAEAAQQVAQAEAEAHARAEAHTQAYQFAQAQALLKAQAEVQAMTDAQARAQVMLHSPQQLQHNHSQAQPQSVDATDILTTAGHDSEALLDGAMDGTMGEDVFSSSAGQASTTDVAAVATSSIPPVSSNGIQSPAKFEETMTLESLRKRIADFADERDWNQFHTPRNLLLALNGEVGELCEIFQWKGEVKNTADWSARDKEHLGEEISDVLIYLVRLADKCDVNLPAALNDKIAKNARKYPAELVRGSSKKYNENKRMRITEESSL
ncbi:hypothetical protein PF005_g10881 [Phytophthora fragariae]|uniref:dCTP pyrophosphatase 1 n=1 Tax=Phytophthora fragariae TaxID=53985 RepID=A0A6A3EWS1_9STRA|nr:hypothetical protein PF003_g15554 [Phytophthora fragariae]KAE8937852.1 hypothetical protein PF009_g12254 [Phytophthora fragariae]KAE9009779.1 hypothetical protein PF011_g10107 [Phytophthora fragariae]KAE9112023.1 hypothetical protein PF007_g11253 [Phytophthora fragariae]KAE9113216.1 hypothetical protein PF010_g10166 [Phytophthora fragariae]